MRAPAREATRCTAVSEEGLATLTGWSKKHLPETNILAVMEHTGVYSEEWADLLFEHGIGSALVNSNRVKYFAKAQGVRHKTDRVDALAILEFAKHFKPVMREPKSDSERELAALTQQRPRLCACAQHWRPRARARTGSREFLSCLSQNAV